MVSDKTFRELLTFCLNKPRVNLTLSDKITLNINIKAVHADYIEAQTLTFDKMSQSYQITPGVLYIPMANIVTLKEIE